MPRQLKTTAPVVAVAAATAADELSREAEEASTAGLSDTTADLVGWVTGGKRERASFLGLPEARGVLAAALGVPEPALAGLSADDVATALDRLRAVVDHCARLAGQVTLDELTGALRRGAGLAALQREMDRTLRVRGKGLAVIFIDVDGLKTVNDRAGHAAGDELLRTTVAALRERLRSYDLVIRYGGDEFVCVLTDSSAADAERTAQTLADHVKQTTAGSVSAGIAVFEPGETVGSLVERADAALYAGRRARVGRPARARR